MTRILSAFIVVAFVMPVLAGESSTQQYSEGKITAASDSQVTLTDRTTNKEMTLQLSPKTQIVLDGKKNTPSSLKEGQTISVSSSKDGEKLIAQIISDTKSQMRCKVKSLSEDRKTLQTTDSDNKETMFQVSASTRIVQGSKLYSGTDAKLENGQPVTVTFLREGDRLTAVEIRQSNRE